VIYSTDSDRGEKCRRATTDNGLVDGERKQQYSPRQPCVEIDANQVEMRLIKKAGGAVHNIIGIASLLAKVESTCVSLRTTRTVGFKRRGPVASGQCRACGEKRA
jgi:hypothetical protein